MLKHISFGAGKKKLAILIPTKDMNNSAMEQHYVKPLEDLGISRKDIIIFNLLQNSKGKSPVTEVINPCLTNLKKAVEHVGAEYVLICDPSYFKKLCKVAKTEPHYGYPLNTIWNGIKGFVCQNHQAIFFNPAAKKKIDFSLKAIASEILGTGSVFDTEITRNCEYLFTYQEIKDQLKSYLREPKLTCDIETYGLKLGDNKLASIAFGKNQTEAFSFPIGKDQALRQLLKKFFCAYQGTLIFHKAPFDTKMLIWELFMEHPTDYAGMLEGLHTLFHNLEDTHIISYLALNTTAGASLRLKDLSFEFTGNYALDEIGNIASVALGDLLKYNATDALATWYVYNKYRDTVAQQQETTYQNVFLPALKTITQMELCGMPINLSKVLLTKHNMEDISNTHYSIIMADPIIIDFQKEQRRQKADKANMKLKKLRKSADDFLDHSFNPNSNVQLSDLLYGYLDLPVLDTTQNGNSSTSHDTLKALVTHIQNTTKPDIAAIDLINHLVKLSEVNKILSTFIPAFIQNSITKDSWQYLYGSFNLGGTKSGRLSSSDPNLQNIPSTGTSYAKNIKECFQAPMISSKDAPNGWLMVGADYASLEDRVSALLTKDPNKLDIYIKKMDGHCLRAYYYFGDQMPDIDPNNIESINSIAEKYPDLRQLSKSPTFLLTYMGTYKGLIRTFGFSKKMARQIEENYHKLYAVSDQWVMDQIRQAGKTGFVELAFGLRLRTPMLPQVIIDSDSLPYEAHKEIKTAGNALGQSYGLLNTHSANLFMQRVWDSPFATQVLPIAQIHDSQYYMIQNNLNCVKWINDNLIECMEWNDLEAIQHPEVKLGASMEVYYPDWAHPIKIPNKASLKGIKNLLVKSVKGT